MRHVTTLSAFLVTFVLLGFGTASGMDRPKLIVGGDHNYPPYEFLEEGKAAGFDIELMRAVAEVMGLDVEVRLGPWSKVRHILANARDVFKEKGIEKPRLKIRAFAENNKTVVTITDNAGGVPDTIIGKIFDLYFTTKETSGGTGIGLYMGKNIIEKNMGGRLSAGNVNDGAQFRIEVGMPG